MAAFTIVALAAEITNDPAAKGYAAKVTAKDAPGILTLLLATGAGSVLREPITVSQFLSQLKASEVVALSATAVAVLQMLTSGGTINLTDPSTQAILLAIFTLAASPVSRAALIAFVSRSGSRAEVLWGVGTTPTLQDVHDATGV